MKVENGMATCGICGRQFELKADDRYISRDSGKTGLFAGLSTQNEEQLYDTFDCSHCGCQNVAQKRNRMWIPEPIEQDDEEEVEAGMDVGETGGDSTGIALVMADEVGPAPTAEQMLAKTDPPGYWTCEGQGRWCTEDCPGPDKCAHRDKRFPGPVFYEEREEAEDDY